ncbi:hypothetical protein A5893_04110 [Pedobacter psychrophilus]|uniref:Uncharacterized protein n=1 Tax=Pedobacter psychrophilus TaxID=1826909 RepID=A0A179DMZ2_9SPHI|nr:hypothetical protein A5893_04110 [Pedobacter psychrophilus]
MLFELGLMVVKHAPFVQQPKLKTAILAKYNPSAPISKSLAYIASMIIAMPIASLMKRINDQFLSILFFMFL